VTDRILANRPEGPVAVPALVRAFTRDLDALDAVWVNDLGGVTFRDGDRYLKWSPLGPVDLDWNYGPGWQDEFFAAYGIAPDGDRIRHYRALWDGAP
jgi:hypothetical protein